MSRFLDRQCRPSIEQVQISSSCVAKDCSIFFPSLVNDDEVLNRVSEKRTPTQDVHLRAFPTAIRKGMREWKRTRESLDTGIEEQSPGGQLVLMLPGNWGL